MKELRCILTLVLALLVFQNMYAEKKKKTNDRINLTIIYDTDLKDNIAKMQEKFKSDIADRGTDRFIFFPLVNLAYSMIAGQAIETAQSKVKNALTKAQQKYKAEWTVSVSKDYFYSGLSRNSALDPMGMQFGGIKTSRVIPNPRNPEQLDTAFYFVCHIDEKSIEDIVKNSRFRLKLDTLLIDLSKTRAKLPENKKFNLELNVRITASWVNQLTQYYKDQELGSFKIALRGVTYNPESPIYCLTGEDVGGQMQGSCFIVPRSYCGYTDNSNAQEPVYYDCWGQGEYSMTVTIKEETEHKSLVNDFFNNYVIQVTDQYGKQLKTNYGDLEALQGKKNQPTPKDGMGK